MSRPEEQAASSRYIQAPWLVQPSVAGLRHSWSCPLHSKRRQKVDSPYFYSCKFGFPACLFGTNQLAHADLAVADNQRSLSIILRYIRHLVP